LHFSELPDLRLNQLSVEETELAHRVGVAVEAIAAALAATARAATE